MEASASLDLKKLLLLSFENTAALQRAKFDNSLFTSLFILFKKKIEGK